jgi:5'-nucleotidase
MSVYSNNALRVAVSSSALFDLRKEGEIFAEEKLDAFRAFQQQNESKILDRGTAFRLVEALLKLESNEDHVPVEVLIISRNHPDVHLRVINSLKHYDLRVSATILTGGQPVLPYLREYQVGLFLSAEPADVGAALRMGVPSAVVYPPPNSPAEPSDSGVRIAFDADCVLFSEQSDAIFRRDGMAAYLEHELLNARSPIPDGPFKSFLLAVSQLQEHGSGTLRIGVVTSRSSPTHERAIRTLATWGVRIDEMGSLGPLDKDGWLRAFRPHIFFDDSERHCNLAARYVSTAQVPYPDPAAVTPGIAMPVGNADLRGRFLLVCRGYLKTKSNKGLKVYEEWYDGHLATCEAQTSEALLKELSVSVESTPDGLERRAASGRKDRTDKLTRFLDQLYAKFVRCV